LIAVVGVASVLAFSVSARTREFGVRLAVGSAPRNLLARVLSEGMVIAAIGIAVGAGGDMRSRALQPGCSFPSRCRASCRDRCCGRARHAAAVASLMPAARASRVDVLQALRSE
jgi:ABC-type antimicrobial peptide transport system permease subunit